MKADYTDLKKETIKPTKKSRRFDYANYWLASYSFRSVLSAVVRGELPFYLRFTIHDLRVRNFNWKTGVDPGGRAAGDVQQICEALLLENAGGGA